MTDEEQEKLFERFLTLTCDHEGCGAAFGDLISYAPAQEIEERRYLDGTTDSGKTLTVKVKFKCANGHANEQKVFLQ